jgi:hypothetical protein
LDELRQLWDNGRRILVLENEKAILLARFSHCAVWVGGVGVGLVWLGVECLGVVDTVCS